jgi:transcriptional regulator with XRE-family HTH domain
VWKQHPLRILRERSGLNQHQIAKRAGMSQTKLSLAENHLVTLSHEEAEQIRNAIVEVTRVARHRLMRDLRTDDDHLRMARVGIKPV